jgi:hypothetical protein
MPLSEGDIEDVREEKEVITYVNGIRETSNKAKPGDLIITGAAGERYVSSKRTFNLLHAKCPRNPQVYLPLHRVRALFQTQDVTIVANWGEELVVNAGGVVVYRLNDNKLYGNQADTFEATYSRAEEGGDIICDLQLPLEEQLIRVREANATLHERDVMARLQFREQPTRSLGMTIRTGAVGEKRAGASGHGFAPRSP